MSFAPEYSAVWTNPFLQDLEFSVRAQRLLNNIGVDNMTALLALDRATFMRQKGAGVKTWREISDMKSYLAAPIEPPPVERQDWTREQKLRLACSVMEGGVRGETARDVAEQCVLMVNRILAGL